MRILIHGLNFAPELVGVGKYTGEMAYWLAGRGHDVKAVTAPPFNPQWKVAAEFSSWRYASEDSICRNEPSDASLVRTSFTQAASRHSDQRAIDRLLERDAARSGVMLAAPPGSRREPVTGRLRVLRCPLWVPLRPSAAKRILHLASFALASFPVMLWQIAWKPDVVMVIEPTLFCLPAAWLSARFCGAGTWLHLQDFEADAGFELGLLRSASLRRAIGFAERKLMSAFGRVSTISGKMLGKLAQKNVPASACRLFPNWVDTNAIYPLSQPSPLRAELGIAREETVALYAGTMARKQGLEIMAEAATRVSANSRLRFVFCGEGPGRSALANLTGSLANVQWIPLQPLERLNDLLNLADIHLLPQKADAADLVMPSKLTGMFASGRPVVATAHAGTQLAQAVEGRGMVVDPGDAAGFANAVEQLAHDRRGREEMGRRAREYAVSELEKEVVLFRFEQELLEFAATG
ncbi:MAG: glycosyl transferase group 1 family protein [Candidatus Sulfotelmatobacter sp.]|nr:glycosyl transferase group 1 family protein [Candidatus Sulfotelmatobacter sp.]